MSDHVPRPGEHTSVAELARDKLLQLDIDAEGTVTVRSARNLDRTVEFTVEEWIELVEEIRRSVKAEGEHLIAVASREAAKATIEGLLGEGHIATPEMMAVIEEAKKVVRSYREESWGEKRRTIGMIGYLVNAVDAFDVSLLRKARNGH